MAPAVIARPRTRLDGKNLETLLDGTCLDGEKHYYDPL